jgi:hypothetical protein
MGEAIFDKSSYVLRRKIFTFLGQKFYIRDMNDQLVGFVKQKAFKLKEDIRVFRSEACKDELLVIKARSIVDFSAAYDIWDPTTQEKIGALRRQGMKSTFIRDCWDVLDNNDQPVGKVEEMDGALATLRKWISYLSFIPQEFSLKYDDLEVAHFQQNWNFFVPKLQIEFHGGPDEIDRRLGLGAAVLISTIEGRQA